MNELLEPHRQFLLDVAYRITGTPADAEDIVQEAFVRALLHPPPDLQRSIRPWLVRVVANLARDQLRARRRQAYAGSWLPAPLEVDVDAAVERRESVGWATLLALEALTPQQRAVLVLREVAELAAEDVADVLGTTADAVRATHTRARRALRDASPREPSDLDAVTFAALQRLGAAIASGDLAGLQSVLTSDVRLVSDSAGQYQSAVRDLLGSEHVARFLLGATQKFGPYETALVRVNDRWALASRPTRPAERTAPRGVTVFTFAPDGRIDRIAMVMADRKLRSVAPAAGPPRA